LTAAVHFRIIPLDIAFRAMTLFQMDENAWKASIQAEKLDFDLQQSWQAEQSQSIAEANVRLREVWHSWPSVAALFFTWLAVGFLLIRFAYRQTLADFQKGALARSHKHTNLDITRMAYQAELAERAYQKSIH